MTASGYDADGSDPIADEDLVGHDMDAQDVANFLTLSTNLQLFMGGGVPA